MERKCLFTLLFSVFTIGFCQAKETNPLADQLTCNLPAPDSFRMTEYSSDYFSVAWLPLFPGAKHTIKLFEQNNFGQWIEIRNYNNVQGSSHTILNYSLAECKLEIYTNCPDGTFGSTPSVLFPKIIVELLTPGVAPQNAVNLNNCDFVYLDDYSWFGFRIRELEGGLEDWNYFQAQFEYTVNGNEAVGVIRYKRAINPTTVYGVDEFNNWPLFSGQIVYTDIPTKFIKKPQNQMPDLIGHVNAVFNLNLKRKVNLCNLGLPNFPWNSDFEFQIMGVPAPAPQPEFTGTHQSSNENIIQFQNPFHDFLEVKLQESNTIKEGLELQLLNLNGHVVLENENLKGFTNFSFETEHLIPGLYFLKVTSVNKQWIFKLLKV